MPPVSRYRASARFRHAWLLVAVVVAAFLGAAPGTGAAAASHLAFDKPLPADLNDLRAIQRQVKKVVDQVLSCTVCVRSSTGQGSGVVVSEDGYVLTAAHVSGPADRDVTIILADGRKVRGKTLGACRRLDGGLVKILEEGPWPCAAMGRSAELTAGQWCIALGHPGGHKAGRPPVVRLGRVLDQGGTAIRSECTLVGGDSGGPLFDLEGRVIGIHSRIGTSIAANLHVPIDTFRDGWRRLASGEVWAGRFPGQAATPAWMGVRGDDQAEHCGIGEVIAGSPAEAAGLQVGDVVARLGGKPLDSFDDLIAEVRLRQPGDEVPLDVRRGEQMLRLRVLLDSRPDPEE